MIICPVAFLPSSCSILKKLQRWVHQWILPCSSIDFDCWLYLCIVWPLFIFIFTVIFWDWCLLPFCSLQGWAGEDELAKNIFLRSKQNITGFSFGIFLALMFLPNRNLLLILVSSLLTGMLLMYDSTFSDPALFLCLHPLPGISKPSFS